MAHFKTRRFSFVTLLLFILSTLTVFGQGRSGGSLRSDNPEDNDPATSPIPGQELPVNTRPPDYVVAWDAWTAADPATVENMRVQVNGADWGHPRDAFRRLKQLEFAEGSLVRMQMPVFPSVNQTFMPPNGWANEFLKRCVIEDIAVEWYCYGYPVVVNVVLWLDVIEGRAYRPDMLRSELFLNGFSLGRVPSAVQTLGAMPWPQESGLLIFGPDTRRTPPQFMEIAQTFGQMLSSVRDSRQVVPQIIELSLEEHRVLERRLLPR
ncbi:MAG: hypothetical protein ACFB20_00540 [Opitutales bacterium]